jgi:UDP-2,4-diacetamido-2,4,6-trideoxy-beta-L-altropyranose hydrolase
VKVIIRADASLLMGVGHIMRCLTLAKALLEKEVSVEFICRDHNGNLIEVIREEGFVVHVLATNIGEELALSITGHLFHAAWLCVSQEQDAQDCKSILEIVKPDWVIVDHYAIDSIWQLVLKPYYTKLMVIDDLGDRNHSSDMLLDQNYGSTVEKYQGLVPNYCRLLVGQKYALLRPEFAEWRDYSLKRRDQRGEFNKILITLGGVDINNVTGSVLAILDECLLPQDVEITVIMGITSPHIDIIKAQAKSLPFQVVVKVNVNNMFEVMSNSDLVIGAAGSTTWERCCLGVPSIQIITADNQKETAHALAQDNAVRFINKLSELCDLLNAPLTWMSEVSKISRNLSDGTGVKKVAEILGRNN